MLAAFLDVALLWYVGRLVDLLGATGPADFWTLHGTEVILVALAVLVLGGCASLTPVQRDAAAGVAVAARSTHVDCTRSGLR